jgi:hypothetical protein
MAKAACYTGVEYILRLPYSVSYLTRRISLGADYLTSSSGTTFPSSASVCRHAARPSGSGGGLVREDEYELTIKKTYSSS